MRGIDVVVPMRGLGSTGFEAFRLGACRASARGSDDERATGMTIFQNQFFRDHEQVVFVSDRCSGLNAIVAIHSTALGPGMGGCRRWRYENEDAALADVLRLSHAMSYKHALAGMPFGGAKAVVFESESPRAGTFEAFGRAVERLGGRYITAEDVGTNVRDMALIAKSTAYVTGLHAGRGLGGDPSPYTALGVFKGIEASARDALGVTDLRGVSVGIQGVGNVGFHLGRLLHAAGATLIVADVDPKKAERAVTSFGARAVPIDSVLYEQVDVLAPCALGGVINEHTAPRLRARIVAGAANNQLLTEDIGQLLMERGILYAPDYIINAGGVISVGAEYLGDCFEGDVAEQIGAIGATLAKVYSRAKTTSTPTNIVADRMAEEVLQSASDATTRSGEPGSPPVFG